MLSHGAVLRKNGFSPEQLVQILDDYHQAGLTSAEVAMMDYATKISTDASSITQADIDALRREGLTDLQITDVALAVVARNFISRFFNAIGADPDLELIAQQPEMWAFLKDR